MKVRVEYEASSLPLKPWPAPDAALRRQRFQPPLSWLLIPPSACCICRGTRSRRAVASRFHNEPRAFKVGREWATIHTRTNPNKLHTYNHVGNQMDIQTKITTILCMSTSSKTNCFCVAGCKRLNLRIPVKFRKLISSERAGVDLTANGLRISNGNNGFNGFIFKLFYKYFTPKPIGHFAYSK